MEYRTYNNKLKLSVLGLGCWAFGGGEYWGKHNQGEVNEVVHAAYDLGINYFDTAESYNEGRSESSLGEAIEDLPRDKINIGTKVSPSNCYYETLLKHCEQSLRRLRTDYIDVYMIHWPINSHSISHFTDKERIIKSPPQLSEAIEALKFLKKQGKVRHYGVSNYSVSCLKKLPLVEIEVNEVPYNLLSRSIEYDTISYCKEGKVGIIAYMPLMQGVLADVYPTLDDVPNLKARTRHFNSNGNPKCRHGENGCEAKTQKAMDKIREICKETGYSMAEISLKWIISNPDVTCTLVGTTSVQNLTENVQAIKVPLDEAIIKRLNQITSPVKKYIGNHIDYYESSENDRTI